MQQLVTAFVSQRRSKSRTRVRPDWSWCRRLDTLIYSGSTNVICQVPVLAHETFHDLPKPRLERVVAAVTGQVFIGLPRERLQCFVCLGSANAWHYQVAKRKQFALGVCL